VGEFVGDEDVSDLDAPTIAMDPELRALGLRKLAEWRTARAQRPLAAPPAVTRPIDAAHSSPADAGPASHERDRSVDAMVAEMATGAERERLERRVAVLEAEVDRLRAVIAGTISGLAGSLGPQAESEARSSI
jgi:hypothetical protein